MADQQMQMTVKQMFDTVSGGYDCTALRFFPRSAEHIAALLDLRGDEQVLDVACGTGHASLALAPGLPRGRVSAADLSPGMLAQAEKKAAALGLRNIEFIERDMRALGFPAGSFDAAVCAFGVFFVEDMDALMAHIAETVRPGGAVLVATFGADYFQPLRDRFFARLASFGVPSPPQTWKRVADEAGCRQLFERAGLGQVRVEAKNVGYPLAGEQEWWDIVWNAGFRRLMTQLSSEDQERFRREHLAEIAELRTNEGIWLDVNVLFTMGRKG